MTLSEKAIDKLIDEMTALRQHLDGAPVPMKEYGVTSSDVSWAEQYVRWYNATRELLQ